MPTGLDTRLAVQWTTVEEAMDRISARNKKMRIIDESLFIRVRGSDPIYAWNSAEERHSFIRKHDWLRASPAIRTVEACVILRMTPQWFTVRRDRRGVIPKRTTMRKFPDVPRQGPQTYYTIEDVIEISRVYEVPGHKMKDFATELEIRHLFSQGYIPYKKTKAGDFIPVWSETIY